jgi:hypothetical protein
MRKLTLFGWGIVVLSLASFWNLPAQEVVAHIRGTVGEVTQSVQVEVSTTQLGTIVNAKQTGAVSQSDASRS